MQEQILQAALFDLDGVVFDTEPQYTVFWGSQCRLYHPEHPGLEHEIKGQTLSQILSTHFAGELEGEQENIVARLNEFERQMAFDYIAGFEAFVADLRSNGVKTAVVTSSNKMKMQTVYSRQPDFCTLFDAILTAEDFDKSKPDPDCYLKAAARLEAVPERCVVFEDSYNGLRSGRAAGMRVVGLATTNPVETIKPLSDIQVSDYTSMTFSTIEQLLTR